MQPAARPAVGETHAYTLGDVLFVRGIAAKGRGCALVWHAGAYEVVTTGRVLARRGCVEAGWAAALQYVETGRVSEAVS